MDESKISQIYERLSQTHPIFAETGDEWTTNGLNSSPFKNLVSVALSAMTTTKRTIAAATALFGRISTPQELLNLDDVELAALIKPAAHYNRKTVNLKKMSQQLIDRHHGEVPTTREELMALTGVGRKCTDIMMHFVFNEPTIAVDTHVYRVIQRLGITPKTSREETADIINKVTPKKYKLHAHEWLILQGMNVCKPSNPRCSDCAVHEMCDYYQQKA